MEGLSFKAGHALNPEAPCAARQNGPARDPPVDFILNVYAEFQQNGPARATHLTPREPQAGPSPPRQVRASAKPMIYNSFPAHNPRKARLPDPPRRCSRNRKQLQPAPSRIVLELSPPTRGRGSKRLRPARLLRRLLVAPHAGAWIETLTATFSTMYRWSPPTRGRGSKHSLPDLGRFRTGRPPRGGVDRNNALVLGPCMDTCRPPRGGVDRNAPAASWGRRRKSRPPRGGVDRNHAAVGIETRTGRSPPTRGRGSKPATPLQSLVARPGRPPRGGVDRNNAYSDRRSSSFVAPHAGAWIETRQGLRRSGRPSSPPTRGRGSKRRRMGRGLCRSDVAPHAGAWIETTPSHPNGSRRQCRPPRGGVDRNSAIV